MQRQDEPRVKLMRLKDIGTSECCKNRTIRVAKKLVVNLSDLRYLGARITNGSCVQEVGNIKCNSFLAGIQFKTFHFSSCLQTKD